MHSIIALFTAAALAKAAGYPHLSIHTLDGEGMGSFALPARDGSPGHSDVVPDRLGGKDSILAASGQDCALAFRTAGCFSRKINHPFDDSLFSSALTIETN
jgi:hypothetical protein